MRFPLGTAKTRGRRAEAINRPGVLIVEDEYLLVMDLELTIRELGHEVVGVASSAEGALGLMESERPGLVLMDIKIEGDSDGIELAKVIIERHSTPVVFITGNIDSGTMKRAKDLNPLGFISKPATPEELRLLLDNALGTPPSRA